MKWARLTPGLLMYKEARISPGSPGSNQQSQDLSPSWTLKPRTTMLYN